MTADEHKLPGDFGASHGANIPAKRSTLQACSGPGDDKGELAVWLGWAQDIAGDHAGATKLDAS